MECFKDIMEGGNTKTKKFGVMKEWVAISHKMQRAGLIERVTFEPNIEGDEGVSFRVYGENQSRYREQVIQIPSGTFKKQGQYGWT